MKKNAFTLAEVLITLAIVGVVAAVSLPTLNTNVQKQGLSAQVSKFYNQYTKAIQMYLVDNELDEIPRSFNVDAFVKKYFKVTQKCEKEEGSENICWASTYRTIDNNEVEIDRGGMYEGSGQDDTSGSYMLADGAVMVFLGGENYHLLMFDINGKKGPNIVGYDYHLVGVFPNGDMSGVIFNDVAFINRFEEPNAYKEAVEEAFQKCKSGEVGGSCFDHLRNNGFRFDY